MDKFIELFASMFSQNIESSGTEPKGDGNDKNPSAHHAAAAQGFVAAVQLFQASLGEGVDLEAELRQRAKNLTDLADLVHEAKASFPDNFKKEEKKDVEEKEKGADEKKEEKKDE